MTAARSLAALLVGLLFAAAALAQKASDPNKALVVDLKGDVSAKAADGSAVAVTKGVELAKGQQLTTGVDSEAKLAFADGSVMVVSEMSQLLVADLLTSGSRSQVAVQLKMGEVAAQVNPKHAFQTDFKITTPTGTASVRGTEIRQVSYHPARGTEVALKSGSLLVENNNGQQTSMQSGDTSRVDNQGNLVTPRESVGSSSQLVVNPALTTDENRVNAFNNQPVGTPPTTNGVDELSDNKAATFIFVFQKP